MKDSERVLTACCSSTWLGNFSGGMFVLEDITSQSEELVSSATAAKHHQFCAPVFRITVESINNLGCSDNEGLPVVKDKKLSEYSRKS